MPVAALPTEPITPALTKQILKDLKRLKGTPPFVLMFPPILFNLLVADFKEGFPDDAYAECCSLAELADKPPAEFSWDIMQVRRLLACPGGPNYRVSSPESQELPFHLKVGRFYLVNPGEHRPTLTSTYTFTSY